MNTTEKGNKLEDEFYNYLCAQKERGELVFGTYFHEQCQIYKKKRYYCSERERDIEFDVVIEVFRSNSETPHLYVVFECKNHKNPINENHVTPFSDQLTRLFRHAAKGIIVVSNGLQTGARNLARCRGMGIVKFDSNGLEIIAERKEKRIAENQHIQSQLDSPNQSLKSLKFSAFYDNRYMGSIAELLEALDPEFPKNVVSIDHKAKMDLPYFDETSLREKVQDLLNGIGYESGPVDLTLICSKLPLDLSYSDQKLLDRDNKLILGQANFEKKQLRYLRTKILIENDSPLLMKLAISF